MKLDKFREFLTRRFPARNLQKPAEMYSEKWFQDFAWAKAFHESIAGDFRTAELATLYYALSIDPQLRIERLREIAVKAERLAEALSCTRLDPSKPETSAARVSSLLLFPLAEAQNRNADEIAALPAKLLDLSIRTTKAIEWIETSAKAEPQAETGDPVPTSGGRPEGTGDRFRDTLFWKLKDTWECHTGQQATFARDDGPPPSILCPFCLFVEDYMAEIEQTDTADAIRARFLRERARRAEGRPEQ